ncbi:hypothetical protein EYF80_030833 [Liparis tanakae]|uniref:Uncharacterized protein n=1 Tax=Liparis tanakae TaxID=230148 RepID=A0A4Z2H0A1_9TELE|nr:hypothetical protein EYF80_030833 [Liparis tanakae]
MPVLALPARPRADRVSSLWAALPRLMSMDSLLVCMLLTEGYPMLPAPPCPPSVLSLLWADELLKVVPHVRLLEGPVEEYTEPGLEASLSSAPSTRSSKLKRGLLVSLSAPAGAPSGDSGTVPTWFMVAWGLKMTVAFFMFSAVVTGACLQGFPPNSLWENQGWEEG